jgi:hypothetical protein
MYGSNAPWIRSSHRPEKLDHKLLIWTSKYLLQTDLQRWNPLTLSREILFHTRFISTQRLNRAKVPYSLLTRPNGRHSIDSLLSPLHKRSRVAQRPRFIFDRIRAWVIQLNCSSLFVLQLSHVLSLPLRSDTVRWVSNCMVFYFICPFSIGFHHINQMCQGKYSMHSNGATMNFFDVRGAFSL